MMINTYATKRYAWGFYFWLDLFSTVSLIPDIGWIWEPLLSLVYSDTSQGLSSSTLLDASRASRAGTRATRLVRLVRLVRIVRIAKLLRQMHRRSNTERYATEQETETTRSRIGTKLLEVTSRRVIILVLVMVLFLPAFDGEVGYDYNPYQGKGLADLHRMPQDYNFSGDISSAFRDTFSVRHKG